MMVKNCASKTNGGFSVQKITTGRLWGMFKEGYACASWLVDGKQVETRGMYLR